jgi:hypothetical protein
MAVMGECFSILVEDLSTADKESLAEALTKFLEARDCGCSVSVVGNDLVLLDT